MKHIALLFATLLLAGCHYTMPDAGHESVLVTKPWFFGHGGVDQDPVKTGSALLAPTTQSVDVNMQPVSYNDQFKDFMSDDGVPLEIDSTLILKVVDSVQLIQRFGPMWYENNIQSEYGNNIRQQVRVHGMNEMAINTSAISDVQTAVEKSLKAYISDRQMPLVVVGVIIGKVLPPDAVKNQRIQTAQQEQRKQTETQRQQAEDARKGAEQSRANADNAYRNSLGLSPEQFVQLENINMQKDVCERGGCTFISGNATALVSNK